MSLCDGLLSAWMARSFALHGRIEIKISGGSAGYQHRRAHADARQTDTHCFAGRHQPVRGKRCLLPLPQGLLLYPACGTLPGQMRHGSALVSCPRSQQQERCLMKGFHASYHACAQTCPCPHGWSAGCVPANHCCRAFLDPALLLLPPITN